MSDPLRLIAADAPHAGGRTTTAGEPCWTLRLPLAGGEHAFIEMGASTLALFRRLPLSAAGEPVLPQMVGQAARLEASEAPAPVEAVEAPVERYASLPLNQVVCADALTYLRGLPDGCCDAIWASPPYNLADPFRGGKPHPPRLTYAGTTGRGDGTLIPEAQYQDEQAAILTEWYRVLAPDGVAFYSHKVRIKGGEAISPLRWIFRTPLTLLQEVVWDRGGTPQVDTRRFLPVSERVYVLTRHPGVKLANPTRLPDVLRIPPTHHKRATSGHPCPTPPELVRVCLSVVPPVEERRRVVLDCYAGTGTTALIATELGMDWLACDREQAYVAIAEARLAASPATMALPLDDGEAAG